MTSKKVYFFAIAYISAGIAHVAVEGMSAAISPLMSLFILIISYVYFTKLNKYKTVIGD